LSRKIIVSQNFRKANPLTAFILSFFFTGLGHVYGGSIYRGTAFLFIKFIIILIPPFVVLTSPDSYYLHTVFCSLTALVILQTANSIDASMKCLLKQRIPLQKYNKPVIYTTYASADIVITLFCFLWFSAFFSFFSVPEKNEPIFEKNDILLVSRIPDKKYSHGETVIIKGESGLSITRIIALPGEKAEYKNSRFLIDGSELSLSIFSEKELHSMSLTNYDIVSELNGFYKYSVIQSRTKSGFRVLLQDGEYLTSKDDRNVNEFSNIVTSDKIAGRVEGIFVSPLRRQLLISPFVNNN
jgi:signal peptidase I